MKPGLSVNAKSFIKVYEEEGTCAAYSGYENTADFRMFLLSNCFLGAFLAFQQVSNLSVTKSLELLRDCPERFTQKSSLEDAAKECPFTNGDKTKKARLNSRSRLACILSHFKDAFTAQSSGEQSWEESKKYFYEATPSEQGPRIDTLIIKPPNLGPHEGETSLEPYNRVYCMLRYFRYTTKSTHFSTRFLKEGWDREKTISPLSYPGWMRSPETISSSPTVAEIQRLDKLPKRSWQISWKRNARFDGKETLDNNLEDMVLPTFTQRLEYDPRRFDAASWRDGVRRQYQC